MFLSDVSIRRPVFTIILCSVLGLFGAISFRSLGVDLMPKVEAPYITITQVYPGADPDVVENRIIQPIEDAVSTISGLKKITSRAAESFGMVICEFELNVSADRAVQDVRDQIAKIERDLPADAEKSIIQKIDIGAAPVVVLVLTGAPDASGADITYVADKKVRNAVQRINGVGVVDLLGKQQREIHVVADPQRLRNYGLTLPDIENAVRGGNLDVPGGRLTVGDQELLLKTHGEADTLEQLRGLVVASPGGNAPILLRDVANVVDTTEEVRTLAALDGHRSMSLSVRKQSDANSVAVSEAVISAVNNKTIDIPPGYSLRVAQNSSEFTRRSVNAVIDDLVLGALLAVLVIMLFLRDWRATFIASLALPTSVVATFAFMRALNFTLNNITLLALSLSIGMLIDDAIVVIENIFRHLEMGKKPREAAAEATAEIGLAVLATTLTIVAVFIPVAFMKGIVGRIFYEFGITVAVAVMVSLFVSFTLTPMGASRMLKVHHPGAVSRFIGRGLDALDRVYRWIVGGVLRFRVVTVLVGVAALLSAGYVARYIPTEFQPKMDQGELDIAFAMPEGSSLDATYAQGERIRTTLQAGVPETRYMLLTVGAGSLQKVNEGKLFAKFLGAKERTRTQEEIAADLRARIAQAFPGQDISVNQVSMASGGNDAMSKPLNVQLRGADSVQLRKSATELLETLRKEPGFVDLSISDRGARPQYGIDLDRDKVAAAGLSAAQVALAVRTAVQGSEVSQFRVGGDRYKVLVKAPEEYSHSRQNILSMPLRGMTGSVVELGELVRPFAEDAAAQVEREDRVRQVSILGNLQGMALGTAQDRVLQLTEGKMPPGVQLKFSGQGQIMKESFDSMGEALLLAVILIFMVLAAQFESFLHPFIIMVSLPLSLIGALGALFITQTTLSMMSFIGIIMLMGLVTKNAILLVDNANQRREHGANVHDALVEAGAARLRPILMTTLAMIFGMLPVALALSEGSEFRAPMAVAVIGGLITSTVLTLLVVPAIYSLLEGARSLLRKLLGWDKAAAEHPPVEHSKAA